MSPDFIVGIDFGMTSLGILQNSIGDLVIIDRSKGVAYYMLGKSSDGRVKTENKVPTSLIYHGEQSSLGVSCAIAQISQTIRGRTSTRA